MPEIRFVPNPTQRRFIESRAEADLFDSRKGEGKSAALAWACFYHTTLNPGAEWVLIRDTWENLRRTTQREFFSWFPPGQLGEYRAGDREFVWAAASGLKGRVTFMGLDSPEDASKLASMPLAGFGMDEPSPAAGISEGISEDIFQTAVAQLRQPGMSWYAAKLAQNNPDETHWTYRLFWEPGTPALRPPGELPPDQVAGFRGWQPREPENLAHLPPGYYGALEALWKDRPDLKRRMVEGKHGFQKPGRDVTPEWSDEVHLVRDLRPVRGRPFVFCYDAGLNPTCIITQVTPLGRWLVLKSFVGSEIGMEELLVDQVRPWIVEHLREFCRVDRQTGKLAGEWRHVGDPACEQREQSNSRNTVVAVIRKILGGRWTPGPVQARHRYDADESALRAVLRRMTTGSAVIQVDRDQAYHVWHALRGGWHRRVHPNGVVGEVVKNFWSHPGDALAYGAAVLFPLAKLSDLVIDKRGLARRPVAPAWHFGQPAA